MMWDETVARPVTEKMHFVMRRRALFANFGYVRCRMYCVASVASYLGACYVVRIDVRLG